MKNRSIIIVVPIGSAALSPDEQISLKHLQHFLGHYPIVCAVPQGSKVAMDSLPYVEFHPKFFIHGSSYNQLLTNKGFYNRFVEYEYILFYQPHALVFSDQLTEWTDKGYDYVAAPWPVGLGRQEKDPSSVGNGGFSLHRVKGFLQVLDRISSYKRQMVFDLLCQALNMKNAKKGIKSWAKKVRQAWLDRAPYRNPSSDNNFRYFEALKHFPGFSVVPPDQAAKFSVEVDPRFYLAKNNGQLPFGCSNWPRWQRQFWETNLLK